MLNRRQADGTDKAFSSWERRRPIQPMKAVLVCIGLVMAMGFVAKTAITSSLASTAKFSNRQVTPSTRWIESNLDTISMARKSMQKIGCGPAQRRRTVFPNARRGVSTIPKEYASVDPTGDYILAKFQEEEDYSEGNLWLPESLQAKPNLAEVLKLGAGVDDEGKEMSFEVKPGDIVLYTRYGSEGTRELELEKTGENLALIKHSELAAKLPSFDNYKFEDFEPLQNFLLVRADKASEETVGGILLTDSDQDKPACGQVVKVGPGLLKDGERIPVTLKVGDNVMYNKYAGDELEDEDERVYVVLKEGDIICKLTA